MTIERVNTGTVFAAPENKMERGAESADKMKAAPSNEDLGRESLPLAEKSKAEEASSRENRKMEALLKDLNKKLYGSRREVRYQRHEKSQKMMVRLMDTESGKLVYEAPSEKSLDLLAKMWEEASVLADVKR
jgi:flagellar protein FlaG